MEKLLQHAISDVEIKRFFQNKINVMRYRDLSKYKNIYEVMGKYERCIILIEAQPTNHWVCVMTISNKSIGKIILFFDSYGIIPCQEFALIPKSFQKLSFQDKNVLLSMLLESEYPVHYSQYRLQKISSKISTCGKWCILRCAFHDISEDDFAKLFSYGKRYGISTDELCCLVYESLMN